MFILHSTFSQNLANTASMKDARESTRKVLASNFADFTSRDLRIIIFLEIQFIL